MYAVVIVEGYQVIDSFDHAQRHTHTHTHTCVRYVGIHWMRDWPVAEASTSTAHNNHKRQMSVPIMGFKPAIPAVEGLHTHALGTLNFI